MTSKGGEGNLGECVQLSAFATTPILRLGSIATEEQLHICPKATCEESMGLSLNKLTLAMRS